MRGWRWLKRFGRSGRLDESPDEEGGAESGACKPKRPHEAGAGPDSDSCEDAEDFVAKNARGEIVIGMGGGVRLEGVAWDVLHGSRSLTVSALAGIVMLAADLVDAGHMSWWQLLGILPVYPAALALFFFLERRDHRRGTASLPPDAFGGGRHALVFVAIVFFCVGDSGMSGLAGWIAYAALLLGSWSDGAWIALVAGRRRVGFWRAVYMLAAGEKEARRECWAALFGKPEERK